MTELKSFAEKTRQLRKERGESQLVFAEGCNISVEEISLIERKKADPRLSTIRKIAEHVGRTVSELVQPQEPIGIYCVKEGTFIGEDGARAECYDIECREEGSGQLLERAPALFTDFKEAFGFACCLNRNKLSHRHFRDVIEDYLAR